VPTSPPSSARKSSTGSNLGLAEDPASLFLAPQHKRLGRGIELAQLAEQLRADGIGLEFLTGELQGSHDPEGVVFTVLAAMAGQAQPRPPDGA
jgi:hypothetical protein